MVFFELPSFIATLCHFFLQTFEKQKTEEERFVYGFFKHIVLYQRS